MELRHLHYFRMVAEELHFRKASEKLFIAQPPLSRQIKDLEEELGVKLFDRNNKRVTLTSAGKYFKAEADKLFSQLEEAKEKVKQIAANETSELRIGYISSVFHPGLAHVLQEMKSVFPYVKTSLFEGPTVKLTDALEKGRLDIAILRAPVQSLQFSQTTLYLDPFNIVTPTTVDDNSDLRQLTKNIKEKPFIFFNQKYAPAYHDKLIEICSRLGFKPNIQHEVNNIHSILQLVEAGLGVSILPESLSHYYKNMNIKFFKLSDIPVHTEVLLAFKEFNLNTVSRWFVEKYEAGFKGGAL